MRPSTLFRVIEDGAVSLGRGMTKGIRNFAHSTRIEYRARKVAAGMRAVERSDAAFRNMSVAQRAQFEADVREITARAKELRKAK